MSSGGSAHAPAAPASKTAAAPRPLPEGTVGVYEDVSPWTGARRVHFRGSGQVQHWSEGLAPTLQTLPQSVPHVRAWKISGEVEGLVLGLPPLWWRLTLGLVASAIALAAASAGSLLAALLVLALWWWIGLALSPRWRMGEEGVWLSRPQGPVGWHLVEGLWMLPQGHTTHAWLRTREGWYRLQVRQEWSQPLRELAWSQGGIRPEQGPLPVRAALVGWTLRGTWLAGLLALGALLLRGLAPELTPPWAPGVLLVSLAVGLVCATSWSVAMRRTGQALWWLTLWGAVALAGWMLYWRV